MRQIRDEAKGKVTGSMHVADVKALLRSIRDRRATGQATKPLEFRCLHCHADGSERPAAACARFRVACGRLAAAAMGA